MDTEIKALEQVLKDQIQSAAQQLRPVLLGADVHASLTFGAWSNDNGIVTGYLSYFPRNNPAEESIDAVISFAVAEHIARFSADICWSNGNLIEGVLENELTFNDFSELLQEAGRLSTIASNEFKVRLPIVITSQKDEPSKLQP